MSDPCRACNGAGGFEGIPASQCPACGKWLPECVDPKWTTRPYNEALDYNPSSYAVLYFNTDDPEGERRLRECLDASRVRLVLWHLDQWLRGFVKYGLEATELSGIAVDEALTRTRQKIADLCDEYNVDLED